MQVFHYKDFMSSLRLMKRTGGRKKKAADQVEALLGRISMEEDDPFKGLRITKHGETRIKKCIKYDLTDFARLVTIRDNDCDILLYVGDHEDVDRWLNSNAGMTFGVDSHSRLEPIAVSDPHGSTKIKVVPDEWSGKLLNRISARHRTDLFADLRGRDIEPLHDLEAGSSPDAIELAVRDIEDLNLRSAISDVLNFLNGGDVQSAERRIELYRGEFRTLSDLSPNEILEVKDGQNIKRIHIGSPEYHEWISNYVNSSHPFEWFLFMHPEQEEFAARDFSGPAKLAGVSGSGKTSIAIRRAVRLAALYPEEKVAIVTLNRSLAELISEIVDYACPDSQKRKRIQVISFFALCQSLLKQFEPRSERLYSDITWGLEEHKDEVYREFYRCLHNNSDAEVMAPTHRLLVAQGVDAERYIAEEFDWIRSALPFDERRKYLEIERKGRGYPLDKVHRENILRGLEGWEKKMEMVGVIDYMGLTTALSRHYDKIEPQFRSIIVDEVQDFGTTELALIRRMVAPAENDLFLCGDAAQHILPKHQIFERAGIETAGRSHSITRNYRNSREILETAYKIFVENLSERHFDNEELKISDPTYANRSSAKPLVLEGESLQQEISAAIAIVEENAQLSKERNTTHSGCIALAGYSTFEVERFGEEVGLPVLNGERKVMGEPLFLSDLEQMKGYEFDTVIIVNCTDTALPPLGMPTEDAFRFSSQFYVALTRAKTNLYLSFSGVPSRWITNDKVGLKVDQWTDVIDVSTLKEIGMPGYLPEILDEDADDIGELNGKQFLYTPYARGIDSELQVRLQEAVPGQARMRSGRRVLWRNVGQLLEDLDRGIAGGGVANVFGPRSDAIIIRRIGEAKLGLRPTMQRRETAHVLPENEPSLVTPPPIAQMKLRLDGSQTGRDGSRILDGEALPIERLKLNAKTLALLRQLKIRTVPDLLEATKGTLRKHLTGTEIDALRHQASSVMRVFEANATPPSRTELARSRGIGSLGFSLRARRVLEKIGVRNLLDLEHVTERQLKRSAACGSQELQEIKRVARNFGVTILEE